jgi:hypothetical protein
MDALKTLFTSLDEKHEVTLMEQNECVLCGTALAFKHSIDYLTLKVEEEGNCPSCRVSLRKREFSLQ